MASSSAGCANIPDSGSGFTGAGDSIVYFAIGTASPAA
jgi:hypothetical protein